MYIYAINRIMTNFAHKLKELTDIHDLFNDITNPKTKDALLYKLSSMIDNVITKMDTLYFNAVKDKKKNVVRNIYKEKHDEIMMSQEMMNTFMPYMIVYNMLQSQQVNVV